MLEADYQTWIHTLLFPFMPVITVFVASFIMLGDLPWSDDEGGGVMTPAGVYQGA